jgi:hypothetical protein
LHRRFCRSGFRQSSAPTFSGVKIIYDGRHFRHIEPETAVAAANAAPIAWRMTDQRKK